MANDREAEKKAKEVADCQLIVEAINRRDGTDYVAEASNQEPADVNLVSPSGHPRRIVQVVTVPVVTEANPDAFVIRSDNKNVVRFCKQLQDALADIGFCGAHVGPLIQPPVARGRVPLDQIRSLACAIARFCRRDCGDIPQDIKYPALMGVDPKILGYVSLVVVWCDQQETGVTVEIPGLAACLPNDGSWIWGGVATKIGKYPGREKDL